ncbi:MAG TPA: S1 RNA-binding domain-containing protein, partial [Patescibacteria group bacterium]|nr:S1 RNA-binding domain-containing protein [Patescibacteria group bacterium]
KIYTGTVTRVEPYGAFVQILPGKDGLVHVSRMSREYVADANTVVKVGDTVTVKCYEVDFQGRINLTMLLEGDHTGGHSREGSDRGPRPVGRRPMSDRPQRDDSSFKRFRDHR